MQVAQPPINRMSNQHDRQDQQDNADVMADHVFQNLFKAHLDRAYRRIDRQDAAIASLDKSLRELIELVEIRTGAGRSSRKS